MNSPARLLMVGIDAGDLDLIRGWLDELPTFRALLDDGELHSLTSPAEVLTSAVWPSFATGRPPGEHGVYYPMQWDPATMRLRRVSADWISFEPFWNQLELAGVRATVLDVPFSLPSRLQRGVEVMNWGSQECLGPFQGNRPSVVRAIRKRFGAHPMGEDVPVAQSPARLEAQRRSLVAGAHSKAELARWLMAETDWELFVTVFAEAHRGGHVLWPSEPADGDGPPADALAEVYRALDAAVGRVIDGAGPDTSVVVFSVHGMGPNFTQEHFAPQIVDRVLARFRGESIRGGEPPDARRSPMRMLREMVPGQLQYLLARMLPVAARDFVVRRAFCGALDWATTPGFLLPGSCESYLRFNLDGRERDGSFDRDGDEHRRYARLLDDELRSLEANGVRVVRDVVSCAERYPGAASQLLPDRVVLWGPREPVTELSSSTLGTMRARLSTGRTGDHRPDGFAIVTGRRPRDGVRAALTDVTDLAHYARSLLRPDTVR